jgi:hypothetical protein
VSLKKGLLDLLKADEDTAAAVSTRVRWGRVPEGTDYPHIRVSQIASGYITTLQGVNATQMKRVQVDCWGNNPREADELAQVVHNLLDSFKGMLSEGTYVSSCLPNEDVDLYDEDGKYAGIAVDFNVWFVPGEFLSPPV